MARARRLDEPGLTFHVWANGVNSLTIFRDSDDKDAAVSLLRDVVRDSDWCVLEYVVMSTHYHVLVRLRKATLSSGFKLFNERYARYFNRKYKKRGHVFESRFNAKLVEGRFARLELARYVANNPVKAHICEYPEEYVWSGYGATIGLFAPDDIVDVKAALEPFGGSRSALRKYVEETDERKRWGQARARPRAGSRPRGTRAGAR